MSLEGVGEAVAFVCLYDVTCLNGDSSVQQYIHILDYDLI